MAEDCGGTITSSGCCSCEVEKCAGCGTRFHYDADELRYCSAVGKVCRECDNYRCNDECCMPPECFDRRDR